MPNTTGFDSTVLDPIDAQNAGLFSEAAYTPIGSPLNSTKTPLPPGWSDVTFAVLTKAGTDSTKYSDSDANTNNGANEFRIYASNGVTKQIVIAFKGTDNLTNAFSDLNVANVGGTQYGALRQLALNALKAITDPTSPYKNYTVVTDGHSLGGAMAQSFALENNLSGFGQNSLPIDQTTINNYANNHNGVTFQNAVTAYRSAQSGLAFAEVNTAGDVATNWYGGIQHDQVTRIGMRVCGIRGENVGIGP